MPRVGGICDKSGEKTAPLWMQQSRCPGAGCPSPSAGGPLSGRCKGAGTESLAPPGVTRQGEELKREWQVCRSLESLDSWKQAWGALPLPLGNASCQGPGPL